MIGSDPAHVVWTSGATEANNAILHHFAATSQGTAWISAIEHPCVMAAAAAWLPGRHRMIPVLPSGVVDMEWITERLREERPGLVAVMAANNETGVLQPWADLAALCAEREIPYFCDAAQWFGKLPAKGLGTCTYVTGCAHKFGGPPGVGFFKGPRSFRPLLKGGPQEGGRRAGTENVPGARACAAALEDREAALRAVTPEERARHRDAFEDHLTRGVPGVQFLGRDAGRLWNTSAVLTPAIDCRRRWVVRLDKLGFATSTGSACASGREKPSHVLVAMGLDGMGDRMLRVSSGWETEVSEWSALGTAMEEVARTFGVIGGTSAA